MDYLQQLLILNLTGILKISARFNIAVLKKNKCMHKDIFLKNKVKIKKKKSIKNYYNKNFKIKIFLSFINKKKFPDLI